MKAGIALAGTALLVGGVLGHHVVGLLLTIAAIFFIYRSEQRRHKPIDDLEDTWSRKGPPDAWRGRRP